MKTESAGGSHVPPMVTFAQAANLGASELGAKARAYSPECVGHLRIEARGRVRYGERTRRGRNGRGLEGGSAAC